MGTRNGEIKKTSLDHFTAVRSGGLIGMDVEKDDELTSARIATEQDDVVMVTQKGRSIRFPVEISAPPGARGARQGYQTL